MFYRTILKSKQNPCINASTLTLSGFIPKSMTFEGMAKISIANRLQLSAVCVSADSWYEYRIRRNAMKYLEEALLISVEKESPSDKHYR